MSAVPSAASRGLMGIGDVLEVLRPDFPDVTISKIRFLESQGLIDPERTPSGYRKFYGPDIERLRWILTQQREHFLPLKVIKDRLAETPDLRAPAPAGNGSPAVPDGPLTFDSTRTALSGTNLELRFAKVGGRRARLDYPHRATERRRLDGRPRPRRRSESPRVPRR
mgnify:CR=1 FL=1